MRAKVALHAQGMAAWFEDFYQLAGATHFKGVGVYPKYDNVKTIGRPYYPQDQVDTQVRKGASGADEMFEACLDEIESNPQVYIWETPANEPSIWDPTVAAGFQDFTQRMILRFHLAHLKVIVGSINTGWPRLPSEDGGAMMRLVAVACQGADGLSFHEYDAADMRTGAGYNCLRYRHFHKWCLGAGYVHPPIYITECGIDRTDPPGPDFGHAGWRIVLLENAELFVDQLMWYEGELQKDHYVKCATAFTAVPSGWWSFDMHQEVSMMLAQRLHDFQPLPPEVPTYPPTTHMAKGFFASEFQGNLDFDAIRDAGYDYVHIRASCGLYKDPTFERNWYKAGQAGLLRSAWHLVEELPDGQAAFFKSIVGDRVPEIGIFADLEGVKDMPPLSRTKSNRFLEAADRQFNTTCDVYSSPGWLNAHGGYAKWEAEDRLLWLAYWADGEHWLLPDGASGWEFWQWKCTDPFGPFPKRVCLDRFAGTREDLHEEYGEPTPPPPEEGDMWFRDSEGETTEELFRWQIGEDGKLAGYGHGYEVVPAIGARVWEVDGMYDDADGPVVQWVRVMKVHSAVQPPNLWWGFPDPDAFDETHHVPFKDKGDYWEAEYVSDNRYWPDRPQSDPTHQGPYFFYINSREVSDMVRGAGFVAGTGYKEAIVYFKPSGAVDPEPPDPEDGVGYFDARSNQITKARYHELMGDTVILPPDDLQDGEEYLKIVELWIREVARPRYARLLVRRPSPAGGGLAGVPYKFFHEGMVVLEGVTNDVGTGQLELGSRDAYAVPGSGPLNLRIKGTYELRAEQMRDYGLVRIVDAHNRHCDVIYEPVMWGEEEPKPPLPDDITEALEQLSEDHDAINARLDTFLAAVAELSAMLQQHLVEIERLLREIADG